jgi:hypothetical protein
VRGERVTMTGDAVLYATGALVLPQ